MSKQRDFILFIVGHHDLCPFFRAPAGILVEFELHGEKLGHLTGASLDIEEKTLAVVAQRIREGRLGRELLRRS